MSFVYVDFPPPADWEPRVLILNADNSIKTTIGEILQAPLKLKG